MRGALKMWGLGEAGRGGVPRSRLTPRARRSEVMTSRGSGETEILSRAPETSLVGLGEAELVPPVLGPYDGALGGKKQSSRGPILLGPLWQGFGSYTQGSVFRHLLGTQYIGTRHLTSLHPRRSGCIDDCIMAGIRHHAPAITCAS